MIIQQIRNATLKIEYGGNTFLIDPWLQDQGTGFSARAVRQLRRLPSNPEASMTGTAEIAVK
jgi:L-ascorbate metabolism protein UlaG (beta-lactamase superfamily)